MSTSQTAELVSPSESLPSWKQEVNARLSAHRTRRGAFSQQQPALPGMEAPVPAAKAARVAARVAERYANVPSYKEALAAEAAAQAARAAEAAAQAVTDVLWAGLEEPAHDASPRPSEAAPVPQSPQYHVDPASLPASRHSRPSPRLPQLHSPQMHSVDPHPHVVDPFEDALVAPAQPLPARVLEFPRELIASRKARPRIAEGPLRDSQAAGDTQLRIFEVEPEAISHQPNAAFPTADAASLPEWSSIRLDAAPQMLEAAAAAGRSAPRTTSGARSGARPGAPFSSRAARYAADGASVSQKSALADMLQLHVAPLEDRLMAAIVDVALVLFAFFLFVLVFVICTPHLPMDKPVFVAAGAVLAGFAALYQWLFFAFAESTPGMRYAKISLCTFDDENPGRKSLQRRVGALFLAALPLGLGFLWALLDDDRLGWHDRMTRTYQRSYR